MGHLTMWIDGGGTQQWTWMLTVFLRLPKWKATEACVTPSLLPHAFFSKHSSLEDLAQQAFFALDVGRNGSVHVQHIHSFFDQRDWPLLRSLPQHRAFTEKEWVFCVQRYAGKVMMTPRRVTC